MVGEYHRVERGSDGFLFSVVATLLFRGRTGLYIVNTV